MSPLPQRRKSAEEIAQLRENLGIPGISAADNVDPSAEHGPEAVPDAAPADPEVSTPPKPVRSLRKSEQLPATHDVAASSTNSMLPARRHSASELEEMRRRAAIAQALTPPLPNRRLARAHPVLLTAGYLLAVAGAACFIPGLEFPLADIVSSIGTENGTVPELVSTPELLPLVAVGCAAAALLVAAFIGVRQPMSRHHAAFIALIAFLVLVAGALHFFPQLQHAT